MHAQTHAFAGKHSHSLSPFISTLTHVPSFLSIWLYIKQTHTHSHSSPHSLSPSLAISLSALFWTLSVFLPLHLFINTVSLSLSLSVSPSQCLLNTRSRTHARTHTSITSSHSLSLRGVCLSLSLSLSLALHRICQTKVERWSVLIREASFCGIGSFLKCLKIPKFKKRLFSPKTKFLAPKKRGFVASFRFWVIRQKKEKKLLLLWPIFFSRKYFFSSLSTHAVTTPKHFHRWVSVAVNTDTGTDTDTDTNTYILVPKSRTVMKEVKNEPTIS